MKVVTKNTLQRLAEVVCLESGIAIKEIQGGRKTGPVTDARRVFSALAKMYGIGVVEVAGFLKYPDHTSVVKHQQAFFLLFAEDEDIQTLFKNAINKLI